MSERSDEEARRLETFAAYEEARRNADHVFFEYRAMRASEAAVARAQAVEQKARQAHIAAIAAGGPR